MAAMAKQLTVVEKVASAVKDAKELYDGLLLDLADFQAAASADDDAFLAEVRATGHDVGLFLLFLARIVEESEQADALEAAVMLRRARPLIDSLVLLVGASSREDLLGLPLASAASVEAAFADPAFSSWLQAHAR